MIIIKTVVSDWIFYDFKNDFKWNNYFIFDLIYDEKLSIRKIVKK